MTIATKHHQPIVYAIHKAITQCEPVRWIPVSELCERFDRSDREIRKAVETIALDQTLQKVIISGVKGYKVAETDEETKEYLDLLGITACSHFDRYWTTKRKYGKHHQMKLPIGDYDTQEFVALKEPPVQMIVDERNQIGFVL